MNHESGALVERGIVACGFVEGVPALLLMLGKHARPPGTRGPPGVPTLFHEGHPVSPRVAGGNQHGPRQWDGSRPRQLRIGQMYT